ncbi:MAG: DUF4184 family protein [Chloroflexi bacterium]|nr:DUF4184 family protein [Chloroflexota bacterium]
MEQYFGIAVSSWASTNSNDLHIIPCIDDLYSSSLFSLSTCYDCHLNKTCYNPLMPFTLSHPAAIIPLPKILKKHTVLSALVIGSMMPDATYFLPVGLSRPEGHSISALFLFCLPAGMALYVAFHFFFKKPFLFLLPDSISRRIRRSSSNVFSRTNLLNSGICVLIGALTHLVWDSFTHADSFFVEHIPVLKQTLFTVKGIPIHVFKVLQHSSTVLGLVILFLALSRWFRTRMIVEQPLPETPFVKTWRTSVRVIIVAIPIVVSVFFAIWTNYDEPLYVFLQYRKSR